MLQKSSMNMMKEYPVMEHFYTIQGEGFHQGKAAYFIRLGGCDVGCVWCDVKESWPTDGYPVLSTHEIITFIKRTPANLVVITGGEPLMHDLSDLTTALHENSYQINIETSGSHPLTGEFDWICLSPKKFKPPLPEILTMAHELKVVIFNKTDFQWAEQFSKNVTAECKRFLQPEWSNTKAMIPLIIDYVKENPNWEISLQIHKYLNVP
ncbi:MAG: 7-carboxy-7-deazaguanine synthase QueE [Chitinophagaceae bacterium]